MVQFLFPRDEFSGLILLQLHDGLVLNYLNHIAGGQQTHADEVHRPQKSPERENTNFGALDCKFADEGYDECLVQYRYSYIREHDSSTDSRRDSWTNEDLQPPEAVRLLDERNAQIGVSTATQGSQVCNEFYAIVSLLTVLKARGLRPWKY